jgi:hypothetical protein
MKITAKKIVYITVLSLLSFSCSKDKAEYYYVPEETILVYHLHDTLIYKDEADNQNIFIVSNIHDGFFKKGEADEVYIQELSYDFRKLNNTSDSCFYSIIIDLNYAQSIYWEKSLFIAYSQYTYPILDEFKVFSETYDNVHLVNLNRLGNIPDTIYYHYKFGILQYKDINGKIWKLFKEPN